MARLGLERTVVDTAVYENTVARFKEAGVLLPTLGQLKDPSTIPAAIKAKLKDVEKIVPGIGGPTVMELSGNPGMVAVQVVISGKDMFNIINNLKKLGATGILTIAMDRLVE